MKLKLNIIVLVAAMLPLGCGSGPANSSAVLAATTRADRSEIWITEQATDRIAILLGPHGSGARETIELGAGTGPHMTTFSPDDRYAYVSGMGNGDLDVIRTDTQQVVDTLHLGKVATHQAKPSPDGSFLLVAQVGSKSLIKVSADEASQRWIPGAALSFASTGRAPICTVFRNDGERAYVSLNPTGLAIVDVPTMTLVTILPTDGFIACGMVRSKDGRSITLAASGGGGHIYHFNIATETLADRGTLGAVDWHSFNMVPNGTIGFGTVPNGDEMRLIDLKGDRASTLAALSLHPTPGAGSDQPDSMGVSGDFVYVSLRASGKLAVVNFRKRTVSYLSVAPAAVSINPANCMGCAVHGVAIRS